MKTFEERYTAWIDGQLEGGARTAFEHELARRAARSEAEADKAGAARLRTLFQDHFRAPVLTNPDFFNHQLREGIDAESGASPRHREASSDSRPALFAWGFARLAGLGALSVFAAAALYYGMMPAHPGLPGNSGAAADAHAVATVDAPAASPASDMPETRGPAGPIQLAQLTATPAPIDLSPDIKTFVPDLPTNPTTITPLHYSKPNVNVLWLNGLDYLPSVAGTDANPDPAVPTTPESSPAVSASP